MMFAHFLYTALAHADDDSETKQPPRQMLAGAAVLSADISVSLLLLSVSLVLPKKYDSSRASSHLQTDAFLGTLRYPLDVDKKSS